MLISLFACGAPPAAASPEVAPEPAVEAAAEAVVADPTLPNATPRMPYAEARSALLADRDALAARLGDGEDRAAIRAEARQKLLDGITLDLIPAWYGTPWDFYGTSTEPGSGQIACGYFVSTVLSHAGIGVERFKLAQQASEYIVMTLGPADAIRRYSNKPAERISEDVVADGPGLWVAGLDNHVGFVWSDGKTAWFCDSGYLDDAVVRCLPASTSSTFASNYRVVGPVLSDATVDAWLAGTTIRTVLPR